MSEDLVQEPSQSKIADGPAVTRAYREMLTTVGDYIARLEKFPRDWRVVVSTQAGGGIAVEHREVRGEPIVAVFGSNGGQFGENPLTEAEYVKVSQEFLRDMADRDVRYTSDHGDHRTYHPGWGSQASCYGKHYDRRIIERMVEEGLIPAKSVDIDRVARSSR